MTTPTPAPPGFVPEGADRMLSVVEAAIGQSRPLREDW